MPQSIKTIAIAAVQGPREMKSWSGIPAHISFAFEHAGIAVVSGGPLKPIEPSYYRWLRSAYWRLGLGWFLASVEPRILRQEAKTLQSILKTQPAQAVLSIQPDPISALGPSQPTVLVHDCTFALLLNYYQQFTGLSRRSIRLGHKAYRSALRHSTLALFASEWAARSAVQDYGADPAKVHVVEFGANLENPPSRQDVAHMIESRIAAGSPRFLFLGVEWGRKGGDDAIALIKRLRALGVPACMDIVGCSIEGNFDAREFCIEHGFLNKSKSEDRIKLQQLFEAASFLLVPSLAECFGCVYCEANAFGIPSIGRDTGGVSQAIRPGRNGFLLSEDGRNMADLAEQVRLCLRTPDEYRKIAFSSRDEFEQRLSWDRFVQRTISLLEATRA